MDTEKLKRHMKYLTRSCYVYVASIILIVVSIAINFKNGTAQDVEAIVLVIAFIALLIAWLNIIIWLGRLAIGLGKSALVWQGLTWLTAPYGILVAYFMMASHVRTAISREKIVDN